MQKNKFALASRRPAEAELSAMPRKRVRGFPVVSAAVLGVILIGCLFAEALSPLDPAFLDLTHGNAAPCRAFLFGTDRMGRDIFSMIWHGGRVSLLIGLAGAGVSLAIALLYGSASGLVPEPVDDAMMRLTEIALSIPSILVIILIQALAGPATPLSVALVIGATGWMNTAKIVRIEVRRLRSANYVLSSRCMNGGFLHVLRLHLLPGLVSPIMFMAVTSIGSAISTEATLSFLGIGLPLDTLSWGSLLAQADQALLSGSWWIVLIPGLFLVASLVCITDLGNYVRRENNRSCGNL